MSIIMLMMTKKLKGMMTLSITMPTMASKMDEDDVDSDDADNDDNI